MAHTSASSGTHVANKETHKSDETILRPIPRFLDYDDFKYVGAAGTPLAEVLSICINPIAEECKLYGTIWVEDDEGTVDYLFNLGREDPHSILGDSSPYDSSGRSLFLCQTNRAISASDYFTVHFDLKDGDLEFLKGSFSWYALTVEDYDKPMTQNIVGTLGSATIKYIVYNLATEAHIEVELVTKTVSSSLDFMGTVTAGYKNSYDYDCDASDGLKKDSEVLIFYGSLSEMVNGDLLPLDRTVVAMPLISSLVIQVHLQKWAEGEEHLEVLWNGKVEFSRREIWSIPYRDIIGPNGAIRVSVHECNYAVAPFEMVEQKKEWLRKHGIIPQRHWIAQSDDKSLA